MQANRKLIVTLEVAALFWGAGSASAQLAYRPVYVTADPVTSIGAGIFATAYNRPPVINSNGQVCFEGLFTGPGITPDNSRALFIGTPGALTSSLRQGSQAPGGAPGVVVAGLWYNANLSEAGQAVVVDVLTGAGINSNNNRGLFYGPPHGEGLVAQTGQSTIPSISEIAPPVVNAAGQYAYLTNLVGGATSRGLWMGGPSQPSTRVLSIGDAAPGYAAPATIGSLATPTINDAGQVSFLSAVVLSQSISRVALYMGVPGAFHRVAAVGDPTPGVAGATFTDFEESPSMNRAGDLAYSGVYTGSNFGVFKAPSSNPTSAVPVFLASDHLPLTPAGTAPEQISDVSLGSSGTVAFRAVLRPGGVVDLSNDDGLWMSRQGALINVSREGQQAPGLPTGVLQGRVSNQSAVNARDQVAFITGLTGTGVGAGNEVALCAWDPGAGLMTLVRTGDLFQVAPGDFRSISFIDFAGSRQFSPEDATFGPAGTGGLASGLNDNGVLAFGLRFADGTYGVFETTVPAPASVVPMLLLAATCARRRRSRSHADLT